MNYKPIVLFNMSYYSHWEREIFNRNYYIYRELSAHYPAPLICIDFLPYNIKSFMRGGLFHYRNTHRKEPVEASHLSALFRIDNNRYLITAPLSYLSKDAFLKKFTSYLAKLNIDTPWAWSYNPMNNLFLNKKLFSKIIFDAVDDWRYHTIFKRWHTHLDNNYKKIKSDADIIFCVSQYLYDMFADKKKEGVYLVPNAVDTSGLLPIQHLKKGKRKQVVYLGTIEGRFDVELVKYLLSHNKTIDFHFIGPVWNSQKKNSYRLSRNFFNCRFMGRFPHTESMQRISSFDAAIVPHRINPFTQSNDPLKIYDFLAQGMPVVTTIPLSTPTLNTLLYYAKDRESFNSCLLKALAEDSVEKRKKRRDALFNHTWEKRVKLMLDLIIKQ